MSIFRYWTCRSRFLEFWAVLEQIDGIASIFREGHCAISIAALDYCAVLGHIPATSSGAIPSGHDYKDKISYDCMSLELCSNQISITV